MHNQTFVPSLQHENHRGEIPMMHKGVEFTVAITAVPSIWKWQFQIGDTVKTGKTETNINLLAIRRVQLRIDRELKKKATYHLNQ
jgi:hypothetical protein